MSTSSMTSSILRNAFRTKPLHVIDAEETKEDLERTLGMFDLICLGMGATIGSGVFSTTGLMISQIAGPAAVLSWLLGGAVCVFNTFAYMELSTRIPSGGSTYAYAYHGIGELPAVIAAWLVSLEYSVSAAGVARSWADKVEEWLVLEHPDRDFHWLNLKHANLLGGLIQFLSMLVLLVGVRFGKHFVNTFTIAKVSVVAFIVVAGLAALDTANLSPFLPSRTVLEGVGGAFGVQGVVTGASQAFFGFSGFDEVCCLSGEARNAKRNVPIAVMVVVVATVLISALCSFVLAGMIPYLEAGSFADGFEYHGWKWAGAVVRAGETVTMPVVVLVGFLAQPRVNYALACDGLVPGIFAQVDRHKNLFWNILLSGAFFTVVAAVLPFDTLWDIVNFGVMMSFILANVALLNIRTRLGAAPRLGAQLIAALVLLTGLAAFLYQEGYENRGSGACLGLAVASLALAAGVTVAYYVKCPQQTNHSLYFTAPLVPFIPAVSILADWYMIAQLSHRGLALSCIWVGAAVLSYAVYGYKNSAGRRGWSTLLATAKLRTPLSAPMLSAEEGRSSSASSKGNHYYTS
ncbi:hypothetical protein PybrP1_000879 [[Pythium] brassicae (nom. inval.)]|nr:hypothetical protein PybrP1_000879 [[Pythium] brassicae (nom. inval.)]